MRYARKAAIAAAFGCAAFLGGAMLDGNLTGGEVIASIGTGLVAGAGTYAVPNAQRRH